MKIINMNKKDFEKFIKTYNENEIFNLKDLDKIEVITETFYYDFEEMDEGIHYIYKLNGKVIYWNNDAHLTETVAVTNGIKAVLADIEEIPYKYIQ